MIKVSVKQPERISCGINKQTIPPVTAPLTVAPNENEQVFNATGNVTGFTPVTVSGIVADELTAIENGEYLPEENEYFKKVSVEVPPPIITLQDKTVTPTEQQQAITADSGYDGLGTVTVGAILATELSVIANGDYTPGENEYYKKVTVNVPEPTGTINITQNGTHDVSNYALAEVDVPTNEVYFTPVGRAYTKNIVMPSTVTSILDGGYGNCHELVTMDMSATSIENLDHRLFLADCPNLKSLTLPSGATGKLGIYFCMGDSNLETVNIPVGITIIGSYAFANCGSLTTVNLSNETTNIGQGAFLSCSSLETLYLPASIIQLSDPFMECSSLKNVTLGDGFLANINLSASTRFTADDMVNMFNALGTVPSGSTRTFYLGATNLAKLTAEQKAIATDKGWTLS